MTLFDYLTHNFMLLKSDISLKTRVLHVSFPKSKTLGPSKLSRWSVSIHSFESKQTSSSARGKKFPSFWVPDGMDKPSQLRFPDGLTNTVGDSRHLTDG